jgi:hypothetical protein
MRKKCGCSANAPPAVEFSSASQAQLFFQNRDHGINGFLPWRKQDLKARGLASPDLGGCLAMSHSVTVRPKQRPDEAAELDLQLPQRSHLDAFRTFPAVVYPAGVRGNFASCLSWTSLARKSLIQTSALKSGHGPTKVVLGVEVFRLQLHQNPSHTSDESNTGR